MVNKKYQCPNHCKVNHPHNVYFSSETGGIVIDEDRLGKRIKEKKKKEEKDYGCIKRNKTKAWTNVLSYS